MHETEDLNELLELLQQKGVEAWIKNTKGNGLVLVSLFEYKLNDVTDLKGLSLRLQNFKELGTLGL